MFRWNNWSSETSYSRLPVSCASPLPSSCYLVSCKLIRTCSIAFRLQQDPSSTDYPLRKSITTCLMGHYRRDTGNYHFKFGVMQGITASKKASLPHHSQIRYEQLSRTSIVLGETNEMLGITDKKMLLLMMMLNQTRRRETRSRMISFVLFFFENR